MAARPLGGLAHQVEPAGMVRERAVGEIDPHHVDAGAHRVFDDPRVVRGGTEGRDDLGPAEDETHAARLSRMSTAGSFLPSTNSRNAPPPVDM